MRIGIYIDVLKEKLRGIGHHVRQLVHHLSEIDKENDYFLYYQRALFNAKALPSYFPEQANFHLRPVKFPSKWIMHHPTLWWDYYLPWIIKRDRIDVFHSPNFFLPTLPKGKGVVTIHDLAFFKMELYTKGYTESLRHWTQKALDSAGKIIAISEHTRQDIEAIGVASDRVCVIYNGCNVVPEEDIQYGRIDELRMAFNLPKHYILFVGVLHPRKNVPFLIHSYAKLKRETSLPHHLVLAGLKGPDTEKIEHLVHQLGLASDVILTGYVHDWQLPLLYKQADLFVLPTLYEGFALVNLEAMHYSVPVISTACSAVREIVGDAAILVPCDDVEAMTQEIHRVLVDDALRQSLIRMGKEQAEKFTWHHCALDTLALYNDVYQQNT